jgi:hypothetical protein
MRKKGGAAHKTVWEERNKKASYWKHSGTYPGLLKVAQAALHDEYQNPNGPNGKRVTALIKEIRELIALVDKGGQKNITVVLNMGPPEKPRPEVGRKKEDK